MKGFFRRNCRGRAPNVMRTSGGKETVPASSQAYGVSYIYVWIFMASRLPILGGIEPVSMFSAKWSTWREVALESFRGMFPEKKLDCKRSLRRCMRKITNPFRDVSGQVIYSHQGQLLPNTNFFLMVLESFRIV
ncbi:hypothetical protein H6P81_017071 [Aristolochia fimbriata]|uniref:Uncharacterized protein n=1 Tax=Aristolochia fimbriata TaxID=158543 RepID=A0AAV7DXC4_ARIFI|nr:hypothetical protein H6P81_017071 [Aristolochia fimbriata]